MNSYQQKIVEYYKQSEFAYKDTWNLDQSWSIHYGYSDSTTKNFHESLWRMNAVMAEKARISACDTVLDAGCGIGGSSVWLAKHIGCNVIGITLSEQQRKHAEQLAIQNNVQNLASFQEQNYCDTSFPEASFDVIFALESVCYAEDKQDFIREAYRLLKQGGRLILADGMVQKLENNQHPIIRKWLDGWVVNFLETSINFEKYCSNAGFQHFEFTDITANVKSSSRRLLLFSIGGMIMTYYYKYIKKKPFTPLQINNTKSAWYQYFGLRKQLWLYGLFIAKK